MEMRGGIQPASYEQTLIRIVRALPTYQQTQLLDYAILLQARLIATAEAKPAVVTEEMDERYWGRAAVRSLAKYWDTPEEDEAWAYLQKAT
jgi:hypothetical protein